MENTVIKALPKSILRNKADGKQKDTRDLGEQGYKQNVARHMDDALQVCFVEGVFDHHAVFERNAPPKQHIHHGGCGHEPDAPKLDQDQHHDLPKQGVGRADFHNRKPRHANCRCGRKKRRQDSNGLPCARRNRQTQKDAADHNHSAKTKYQYFSRIKPPSFSDHAQVSCVPSFTFLQINIHYTLYSLSPKSTDLKNKSFLKKINEKWNILKF